MGVAIKDVKQGANNSDPRTVQKLQGFRFPTTANENDAKQLGIIIGAFNEKEVGRKGDRKYVKEDTAENFQGAVLLPMPNSIQDAQGHEWSTYSVTDMIGEVVGTAGNFIGGLGGKTTGLIGKAISGAGAAMQTDGTPNKLARRTTGIGLDPNTRLEYTGEQLREFTFNFVMIPESEEDSKAIRDIIRFFRINGTGATSLGDVPGTVSTELNNTIVSDIHAFITEPGWFTIDFRNKHLNTIYMPTQMVLVSFTTSLFEDGYAAFYEDDSPKKVSMTLAFKERLPKYSNSW
jgi:hypothetical protein